jgi:hypothetical protein
MAILFITVISTVLIINILEGLFENDRDVYKCKKILYEHGYKV